MKTDPRLACVNVKEHKGWAFIHDALAHPLMAWTSYSRFSIWLHDATSKLAWPRLNIRDAQKPVHMHDRHGMSAVREIMDGFYSVTCPFYSYHTVIVKASDAVDAMEQATIWFDYLKPRDSEA